MRRKISPKFHVKNGVKNGKFHANFTLLGRSAEKGPRGGVRDGHESGAMREGLVRSDPVSCSLGVMNTM